MTVTANHSPRLLLTNGMMPPEGRMAAARMETALTKGDFARMTKFTPKTLERWNKQELIPAPIYLGAGAKKRVRWLASDVDLWLRSGCPDRASFETVKSQRRAEAEVGHDLKDSCVRKGKGAANEAA